MEFAVYVILGIIAIELGFLIVTSLKLIRKNPAQGSDKDYHELKYRLQYHTTIYIIVAGVLGFAGLKVREGIQENIDSVRKNLQPLDDSIIIYRQRILELDKVIASYDSVIRKVSLDSIKNETKIIEGYYQKLDNQAMSMLNKIESIEATLNDFTRVYISPPKDITQDRGKLIFPWDSIIGKNHPNKSDIIANHTMIPISKGGTELNISSVETTMDNITIFYNGYSTFGDDGPIYLLIFSK